MLTQRAPTKPRRPDRLGLPPPLALDQTDRDRLVGRVRDGAISFRGFGSIVVTIASLVVLLLGLAVPGRLALVLTGAGLVGLLVVRLFAMPADWPPRRPVRTRPVPALGALAWIPGALEPEAAEREPARDATSVATRDGDDAEPGAYGRAADLDALVADETRHRDELTRLLAGWRPARVAGPFAETRDRGVRAHSLVGSGVGASAVAEPGDGGGSGGGILGD
jgi:hypothetical protein